MFKHLSLVGLLSMLVIVPGCWCGKTCKSCKPVQDNKIETTVEVEEAVDVMSNEEMASLFDLYEEMENEEELRLAEAETEVEQEAPRKM